MKQIIIIFILFLSIMTLGLGAETINVPEDYETIQEGIVASVDGDSVLVAPGTYYENINFNGKGITLGSWFCTTQDTSYISQTLIDGGQNESVVTFENSEDTTSVLTGFSIINGSASNSNIHSHGGGVNCWEASPKLENLLIENNSASHGTSLGSGGGIYGYDSNLIIRNTIIRNNSAVDAGGGLVLNSFESILENVVIENNSAGSIGGGIYISLSSGILFENVTIKNNISYRGGGLYSYSSDPYLINVTIKDNTSEEKGGGLYCRNSPDIQFDIENRCNIYNNIGNGFGIGNDIFTEDYLDVIVDTFTVLHPTEYHATPLESFSFDIQNYMEEQVYDDLYISPEGSDTNSGLTIDDPLKTISHASMIIYADSLNPLTIHLSEGIYSNTTTGEIFPVNLTSYITLAGEDRDTVILDAEDVSRVVNLQNVNCIGLSQLSVVNGNSDDGAGIYCYTSSGSFENLYIMNNIAYIDGGGIYLGGSDVSITNTEITGNTAIGQYNSRGGGMIAGGGIVELENVAIYNNESLRGGGVYSSSGSLIIRSSTIHHNHAEISGGGILNWYPNMELEDVSIRYNTAGINGGGIYNHYNEGIILDSSNRCNIYQNNANSRCNGCDIYSEGFINVIVDTFTVMNPTDYHTSILENFEFDILHGFNGQIDADLYVSPDGDNMNSGLSADMPLKTIQYAASIIQTSNTNPHTIYLAEGTYSPFANDDFFPISLPDNITLTGVNRDNVILNGVGEYRVMSLVEMDNVIITNLTIDNGVAEKGGGIYCNNTDLVMENVIIKNCAAESYGGGLYIENESFLSLDNLLVVANMASSGGGIYCKDSGIFLNNFTIADNTGFEGSGLYQRSSAVTMINGIIWNNSFNEVYLINFLLDNVLTIAYTDLTNGIESIDVGYDSILNWLEGNITCDPQFTDIIHYNYCLMSNSPCINAGTAYYEYEDEVLIDLEEDEYYGSAPDMGAFEYGLVEADEFKIENVKCKISNYPNPFNPETQITFSLPETEHINLSVYNLKGQLVKILADEILPAGENNLIWNGKNELDRKVSSGIYLLRLKSDNETATKKIMLMK